MALIISACSASGGGSTGSAGVKGFASGVITAKGSIFVNGIEYETTSSAVTVDSLPGDDTDLKVGMVVNVKGHIDSANGRGVADEVEYASSIDGKISSGSIDAGAGTFSVFGMDIVTDPTTVYEGSTGLTGLSPLAAGDRVEISGIANGNTLVASRVELKDGSGEDYKIRGVISDLSGASNGTFTLTMEGDTVLSVSFTGTLRTGIVSSTEVKIEVPSSYTSGTVSVAADKIEARHELRGEDGDRVEAEGIVSGFTSGTANTFIVHGITVSADHSLIAGVVNGVEVSVKGDMAGGTLVASKVRVKTKADLELQGVVTSPDTTAGTLLLDGVLVYVTPETIFRDDTETPVLYFGLDDLAAADTLEIKAYRNEADGHVMAVKIERHESDSEATVKGVVTSIEVNSISVLGLPIDTTGLFGNTGDRDSFLSSIVVGDTVNLTGTVSGTTVTWTAVESDD